MLLSGGTKGNLVLPSGLSVDLRVIPRRSFGAALQYFSGSKEHNVAMRTRAVREGLRVNEWGVFRVPEGVDDAAVTVPAFAAEHRGDEFLARRALEVAAGQQVSPGQVLMRYQRGA